MDDRHARPGRPGTAPRCPLRQKKLQRIGGDERIARRLFAGVQISAPHCTGYAGEIEQPVGVTVASSESWMLLCLSRRRTAA